MTQLIGACLAAPLVAVSKRKPSVLHAAEMETIIAAWPDKTVTSACGVSRLRLLAWGDDQLVLWPPMVKGLPDGRVRCRDCHEATGRKRPRARFARRDAS